MREHQIRYGIICFRIFVDCHHYILQCATILLAVFLISPGQLRPHMTVDRLTHIRPFKIEHRGPTLVISSL